MTQLITAICDDNKQIVTISDRMVSTSDMTLTFEPEEQKADIITSKALILTGGTTHEPDLINDIRKKSIGKKRIVEIANIAKDLYQKLRNEHIKDEILKPIGFNSFEEYYQCQKILNEGFSVATIREIENYDLDVTLLLSGIDENEDSKGHIIEISNPGKWRSFDTIGFCCIGMGSRHAMNVFAWYRYTQNIPLNEVIYIVFEAKKRAEIAGGVGKDTDIFIVNNKGIKKVSNETIKELEGIYNERETKRERRGFEKSITELGIKFSKMEDV